MLLFHISAIAKLQAPGFYLAIAAISGVNQLMEDLSLPHPPSTPIFLSPSNSALSKIKLFFLKKKKSCYSHVSH